jgi:hypothetical protein
MGDAAKSRSAIASTTAARIYLAFQRAAAEDGITVADWSDLGREGSRPWFAVAAAADEIVSAPKDVEEPYDYELQTKVEPIKLSEAFTEGDGTAISDVDDGVLVEVIPDKLRIRPMVAGDLYLREFDEGTAAFNLALRAHVHGIERDMLEFRLDPADAEAAYMFLVKATGTDAWQVMRDIYLGAGGLIEDVGVHGWRAATHALLAEETDAYYLLRCRTPGIGTIKIGPIRVGHMRIYDDVSSEKTEWEGRLAALASATGRRLSDLERMRIEDVVHAWSCFQILKKKADLRARSIVGARLSSLSTGGDGPTSSPSPSKS